MEGLHGSIVTQSEIAFLAIGLVLGVAVGVALWQAVRTRPAQRREVRLTIAPNSIPARSASAPARRSSTLAMPGGADNPGPVPGSPDAQALDDGPVRPHPAATLVAVMGAPAAAPVRTPVPTIPTTIPDSAVGIPIVMADDTPRTVAVGVPAVAAVAAAAGVQVVPAVVPVVPAVPAVVPVAPAATRTQAGAVSASLALSAMAVAVAERPEASRVGAAPRAMAGSRSASSSRPLAVDRGAVPPGPDPTPGASPVADPKGPIGGPAAGGQVSGVCVEERRMVDERCALADAARDEARRAADALRAAQRSYDALRERVERAEELSDPRHVSDVKARLHATFRAAAERAPGPDESEAAAREWLSEINRLNTAVREATRQAEAGNAELRAQQPGLERLALEADAARISAENAAEGCHNARERLAGCEEDETRRAAAAYVPPPPEEPHPFDGAWPAEEPALVQEPVPGPFAAGLPAIVRVLNGDRGAREQIVAALAGSDSDGAREWHLRVAHLVDAITARAIEDGYLELPADDPFWSLFSAREVRDIVGALSALGFRFDGMGGFADGRVPAARDLSLAAGYAGLDRMRIRTWPRESEMAGLYSDAVVAADEWLADQAGDLSLGRMVDALGSRAAELADLWNAWGRVRPALLAD